MIDEKLTDEQLTNIPASYFSLEVMRDIYGVDGRLMHGRFVRGSRSNVAAFYSSLVTIDRWKFDSWYHKTQPHG